MALSQASIAARLLTASLPTFPRTVTRLEHLIHEAEAPPQTVAAVIATDPGIATLVIGQANAAGHATTRITEAVRRIGLGVVISAARAAMPAEPALRGPLATCWAQANAVAVMLPLLVDYRRHLLRNPPDDETLHLVGLSHDLGHVIALSQFPAEYARAAERLTGENSPFDRLLGLEIGATPAQMATLASRTWSLPTVISEPMVHWRHPNASSDHTQLCACVHIAHVLVHAAGFTAASDRYVPALDDWALSALELRIADIETLLTRMYDSMDELELYEGALRS